MPFVRGNPRSAREEDQAQTPGAPVKIGSAGLNAAATMQQSAAYGQPSQSGPGGAGDTGGGNGRFINFARYFDANKQGANKMADNLGNNAEQAGQSAGQAQGQAQRQFSSGVQDNTLSYNGQTIADPRKPVDHSIASYNGDGDGEVTKDPNEITRAEAGTRSAQGGYAGPNNLTDAQGYAKARTMSDYATQQVGGLQDFAGIQGQLQAQNKGSAYTNGVSKFDAGLTQTAGRGRFEALGKRYGGLSKALDASRDASGAAGANAAATTANTAAAYGSIGANYDAQKKEFDENPPYDPVAAGVKQRADQEAAAAGNKNEANARHETQQVTSTNDDNYAWQQGSAVHDAWEAAGKPPFDGWYAAYKAGQ